MISAALNASVEAIMREANARAIIPHYRTLSSDQIDSKEPDDVVTVADKESEAFLTERLIELLPEATVVGEEAAFADKATLAPLRDSLCWIVDPLDGTNNFAKGKAPFGILIALADKGETLGGWILDSLTGRFCHAGAGAGAWIDGERITARTTGQTPPVAAISTMFMEAGEREQVTAHVAPHYDLVDIPRCAAEQYPRLLLGTNDIAVFNRTWPWDHAGGVLFLTEAGGKAARGDGSPYRVNEYDRRGLIAASSPRMWDEFAELVARMD